MTPPAAEHASDTCPVEGSHWRRDIGKAIRALPYPEDGDANS